MFILAKLVTDCFTSLSVHNDWSLYPKVLSTGVVDINRATPHLRNENHLGKITLPSRFKTLPSVHTQWSDDACCNGGDAVCI